MIEIGIVGKPNVGKSTFFAAATLAPAEIASYPFTTVKPNRGVAYVRAKCPHKEFNVVCNPQNSRCENGIRYVPVQLIDVAGLVPDAHKGRGLGNKFLDDLRQASCLIHIVDASGSTTVEGNPCKIGQHDPLTDILFLEDEIAHWIKGIIEKGWQKIARQIDLEGGKVDKYIHERLTGLGITEGEVTAALRISKMPPKTTEWSDKDFLTFAKNIQRISKPLIIAANKCDIAPPDNIRRINELKDYLTVPTCAECELALKRAVKSNLIRYEPGSTELSIIGSLTDAQTSAINKIKELISKFGSTGVQKCIENAAFNLLKMIVVYPVEDETKLTDKSDNVLPDAYLMKGGSTARDLAYKVHTELGENFIRAINVRTKRVVGQDYVLNDSDIIKIIAK